MNWKKKKKEKELYASDLERSETFLSHIEDSDLRWTDMVSMRKQSRDGVIRKMATAMDLFRKGQSRMLLKNVCIAIVIAILLGGIIANVSSATFGQRHEEGRFLLGWSYNGWWEVHDGDTIYSIPCGNMTLTGDQSYDIDLDNEAIPVYILYLKGDTGVECRDGYILAKEGDRYHYRVLINGTQMRDGYVENGEFYYSGDYIYLDWSSDSNNGGFHGIMTGLIGWYVAFACLDWWGYSRKIKKKWNDRGF